MWAAGPQKCVDNERRPAHPWHGMHSTHSPAVNLGKRFVFLATLLTCSLAAAAEFSTLSPRCEAAQQRSCRQTQTETKSRKRAESDKQPLAQIGLVSNCGPAGEIWKHWPEKNEKDFGKSEVLLSKAASSVEHTATSLWR